MKPRFYPLLSALLALLGAQSAGAADGLEMPAQPPSFPAAPGQPHTYLLAIQSAGVPLTVAEAVRLRDSFLVWAGQSGWRLASHEEPATVVVHLDLSYKSGADKTPSRALIWSDFVDIYTGEIGLLADEPLSPTYVVPVACLDYPFGYWEFAFSNFDRPGIYYQPIVRHQRHPVSPVCPPRPGAAGKPPGIISWVHHRPAQASPLPASRVVALARDPDASELNFNQMVHDGMRAVATRPATAAGWTAGAKAAGSGRSSGGGSWSGFAGHSGSAGGNSGGGRSWGGSHASGGGGGGRSWGGGGGGGGHSSGGGGGGGGGGGHASGGGSSGGSSQPAK